MRRFLSSVLLGGMLVPHPFLFTKDTSFIERIARNPPLLSVGMPHSPRLIAGVLPHHAPLMFPAISSYFSDLSKQKKDIKTFIVLGPDHFNKAKYPIIVSDRDFKTPFGVLKSDTTLIKKLVRKGAVKIDSAPFNREHAIQSHTAFIKRYFPRARIVPILFHASATFEEAKAVADALSAVKQKNIFVLASIDFSHYLTASAARPIDERSLQLLGSLDERNVQFIDADSPAALITLLSFVRRIKSVSMLSGKVYNTADFSINSTNTTGYVLGVFGLPR